MAFHWFIFILRINHETGLTISGLAWNPKGNNEIAFTDNQVLLRDELTSLGSCVGRYKTQVTGHRSQVIVLGCFSIGKTMTCDLCFVPATLIKNLPS